MKKIIYLLPVLLSIYSCDFRTYEEKISDYNKLVNNAILASDTGSYSIAIKDLNEAIEITDTLSSAYLQKANCFVYQKKYNEAIDDLTRVIQIEGEKSSIYSYRAACYMTINEKSKFKEDIDVYLKYHTNDRDAYVLRSEYFVENNNFDEAIEDLNSAISIVSTDPELYLRRGNIYSLIDAKDKALSDFDNYILFSGNSIDVSYINYKKGLLHVSLSKLDLAIIDFSRTSSMYRLEYLHSKYEKEKLARMLQTSVYTIDRLIKGMTNPTSMFSKSIISLVNKTIRSENVRYLDPKNSLRSLVVLLYIKDNIYRIVSLFLFVFLLLIIVYKQVKNKLNGIYKEVSNYKAQIISGDHTKDQNLLKPNAFEGNGISLSKPIFSILFPIVGFIIFVVSISIYDSGYKPGYVDDFKLVINTKQEVLIR